MSEGTVRLEAGTMASDMGQLPVTADNIQEAIRLMYGQDPEATQAASRWLTAAKASPQAWDFLWVLLMPDKSDPEQFLGATLLRDKIREHWCELPPERAADLKSRVLETTIAAQTKQGSTARALNEALAALALQMTPDHWPEVVPDLTRTCQSLGDAHLGAKLLLSILTELPNELNKCHISSAKRQNVKNGLKKHIPQVLDLVLTLLKQGAGEQVASRCMELLGAWVDLELLCADLLPVLDLVLVPFVASPALISVTLDMMDRVVSSPFNYNYPNSVLELASRVLTLTPFIKQFVDEKEPESLVALGNVFTSLMTSHSRTFVSALTGTDERQAEVAWRTIGAILDLSSVPGRYPTDETVSKLTFGVWYTLQDDILASDEHQASLKEQLQPVYSALLNVMAQKSMLPKDPAEYGPDEAEAFRRYRQDILDFYTYTQSRLGDYILNSFIIYLPGAMQAVREDPSNWPALESVPHGLTVAVGSHRARSSPYAKPETTQERRESRQRESELRRWQKIEGDFHTQKSRIACAERESITSESEYAGKCALPQSVNGGARPKERLKGRKVVEDMDANHTKQRGFGEGQLRRKEYGPKHDKDRYSDKRPTLRLNAKAPDPRKQSGTISREFQTDIESTKSKDSERNPDYDALVAQLKNDNADSQTVIKNLREQNQQRAEKIESLNVQLSPIETWRKEESKHRTETQIAEITQLREEHAGKIAGMNEHIETLEKRHLDDQDTITKQGQQLKALTIELEQSKETRRLELDQFEQFKLSSQRKLASQQQDLTSWHNRLERLRSGILRQLPECLKCSICLNLFRRPVTMACGHTFCDVCIERNRCSAVLPDKCPMCRQFIGNPVKSAAISQLVELMQLVE